MDDEPKRYTKFREECEAAGLDVQHYRGRFFYEGPAVATDSLETVFRATKIDCQWDQLGLGWIVYPA